MIAVLFESRPKPGKMQRYLDMGAALHSQLERFDGFISIERFKSVTDEGKLLAVSYWQDEEAVREWRNANSHRSVQRRSRDEVFDDYRLRVAAVIRDYGMFDRDEAPGDSDIMTREAERAS